MKETIKDWLILGFWLLFASPMIIGLVLMTIILLICNKIYNLFNKKPKNTMKNTIIVREDLEFVDSVS